MPKRKRIRRTVRIGDILHTSGVVTRTGGGLSVSLPKAWVEEHNIKAGDRVVKVANSMLTINPKPPEEAKR